MKKRILLVLFCIVMIIGIAGCGKNEEELESNKVKDEKVLKDATMIIKKGTLTKTGTTIIIKDLNKEELHTYGESFRIEKKENGKWEMLKTIIDEYGFNLKGYFVGKNHELEMEVNWEWLYGELEKGKYRLVKDAAINKNDSYLGSGVVYAEFTID